MTQDGQQEATAKIPKIVSESTLAAWKENAKKLEGLGLQMSKTQQEELLVILVCSATTGILSAAPKNLSHGLSDAFQTDLYRRVCDSEQEAQDLSSLFVARWGEYSAQLADPERRAFLFGKSLGISDMEALVHLTTMFSNLMISTKEDVVSLLGGQA